MSNNWTPWIVSRPAYSERHRPIQIRASKDDEIETTTADAIPAWRSVANMVWRWAEETAAPQDRLAERNAEIERLQEQVAVLRDALNIIANTPVPAWDDGDLWTQGMNAGRKYCAGIAKEAITDTAPAAEAYRQRVRREALGELKGVVDDCCLVDGGGKIMEFDYADFERRYHAVRNLMKEGPDNG